MVIADGAFSVEQSAVAIFVVRIRPLVPIAAYALVAAILHHEHGFRGRLVHVEHLAAIFGHLAVEHISRTDGTASVGVILVANCFHLGHMSL